jgi:hypothetical protein
MGIAEIAETHARQPGTKTGTRLDIAQAAYPFLKRDTSERRDVHRKGIWLRFAHSLIVAYMQHENNRWHRGRHATTGADAAASRTLSACADLGIEQLPAVGLPCLLEPVAGPPQHLHGTFEPPRGECRRGWAADRRPTAFISQ